MNDVILTLLAVYAAVGVAFGTWYYVSDYGLYSERSEKAVDATILAVFWLPINVAVVADEVFSHA